MIILIHYSGKIYPRVLPRIRAECWTIVVKCPPQARLIACACKLINILWQKLPSSKHPLLNLEPLSHILIWTVGQSEASIKRQWPMRSQPPVSHQTMLIWQLGRPPALPCIPVRPTRALIILSNIIFYLQSWTWKKQKSYFTNICLIRKTWIFTRKNPLRNFDDVHWW